MAPRRKISPKQMTLLVEFAESHRDIALGRFPVGPQAARTTRELWDSVATKLNSVSDGVTKTPDQWRRYWIEFKAKTKAKAADARRSAPATSGRPTGLIPLNDIEQKVLAIIGPGKEGLPGARLPVNIPSADDSDPPVNYINIVVEPIISCSSPNAASSDPLMESSPLSSRGSDTPAQDDVQTRVSPLPSPSAETKPPLNVDTPIPADEKSNILSGHAQRPTPPVRLQRSRSQRQTRRNGRMARWIYTIETRRLAAEERRAAALEQLVELVRKMQNDIHTFVRRTE